MRRWIYNAEHLFNQSDICYVLYDLHWAQRYQYMLDKVCYENVDVYELIAVFAKVPVEQDYSEAVYEHIFALAPFALKEHSDFIQYVVETLLMDYYTGIERILRNYHLPQHCETIYKGRIDKYTAILEIITDNNYYDLNLRG